MIELGHALNLSVVAEGVETIDQLGNLQNAGCDTAQGFLFSRPRGHPDVIHTLAWAPLRACRQAPSPDHGAQGALQPAVRERLAQQVVAQRVIQGGHDLAVVEREAGVGAAPRLGRARCGAYRRARKAAWRVTASLVKAEDEASSVTGGTSAAVTKKARKR